VSPDARQGPSLRITNNTNGGKNMAVAAQKPLKHMGETKAVANHDHDMIHELSKRIDAV
jgi:hypothetical protein